MALFLSESTVRAVLPMADLVSAMGPALAEFSAGRAVQPVRTVVEVGEARNFFGVMPAVLSQPRTVGAKLVTVYHHNHTLGLPSHLATIVLLDHGTGALLAVLDGRYITEARTAAVSAVSVQQLARAEASSLAIIGSGVQARSHLEAIRHVRSIDDVRVFSRTRGHAEDFARDMSATYRLGVRACNTASEAVRGADIVVLVTASPVPVIEAADIAPGTHIAAVGACRPNQREMPTALVQRARVFVDARAGALREAGDLLLPIQEGAIDATHIVGELGDVLLGQVAGRQHHSDVTIFKSLGMAVEDVVAAQLAFDRASAAGLGQVLDVR